MMYEIIFALFFAVRGTISQESKYKISLIHHNPCGLKDFVVSTTERALFFIVGITLYHRKYIKQRKGYRISLLINNNRKFF